MKLFTSLESLRDRIHDHINDIKSNTKDSEIEKYLYFRCLCKDHHNRKYENH